MQTHPNRPLRLLLLRLFLIYSGLGWAVCLAGVFVPAKTAFAMLEYLSGIDAALFASDPMIDYWLRMAAAAFSLVGAGFLILAVRPRQFRQVLPFAGAFMLIQGLVLAVHGLRLGLGPNPFFGDVAFCLAGGIGILCTMGSVKTAPAD